MFKKIAGVFSNKKSLISKELELRLKIDDVFSKFIKNQILKESDFKYKISYSIERDIIKIKTDNKLIDQEIAIRIKSLEDKLKQSGVVFKKLLI